MKKEAQDWRISASKCITDLVRNLYVEKIMRTGAEECNNYLSPEQQMTH